MGQKISPVRLEFTSYIFVGVCLTKVDIFKFSYIATNLYYSLKSFIKILAFSFNLATQTEEYLKLDCLLTTSNNYFFVIICIMSLCRLVE